MSEKDTWAHAWRNGRLEVIDEKGYAVCLIACPTYPVNAAISDRKHDVWDAAKIAIAKAKGEA